MNTVTSLNHLNYTTEQPGTRDYHQTQATYLPLETFYQQVLNQNPLGCRPAKLTNTVQKLIKGVKSFKGIRLVLIQLIFPFLE
jgi:hypothetical protein